jgi:hypothetical protein
MKRANAIPNSDPESESTRLSVRRSRSKLFLLAPSAERRAISGRRAAERAVIKPARLRQAINSTARTAAESASRLERAPLTTTQRAPKAAIEALEDLAVDQHKSWKIAIGKIKRALGSKFPHAE